MDELIFTRATPHKGLGMIIDDGMAIINGTRFSRRHLSPPHQVRVVEASTVKLNHDRPKRKRQ